MLKKQIQELEELSAEKIEAPNEIKIEEDENLSESLVEIDLKADELNNDSVK